MTSCYKVFSCPHCAKFTYAKAEQKSRICSICNKKIDIQKINSFEAAENVAKAHKLVQNKNISWLRQKGIRINMDEKISLGKKSNALIPQAEPSKTTIFRDISNKVIKMLQERNIYDLQNVADPYLLIFFKSTNPPVSLSFFDFKRFFLAYISSTKN